jgi:hypothetical protein
MSAVANKDLKLACYLADFEEFYRKYKGVKSDSMLVNEFLAKCKDAEVGIKPLLMESIWLIDTLSLRPMPEKMSERVWARIKRMIIGMKQKGEEKAEALLLNKRPDLLLLLLYNSMKKLSHGIRGITRIMKYVFLLIREKELNKYINIEENYSFAHHKLGPFDKRLYEDIDILRRYDLIEKVPVQKISESDEEKNITKFFELDDANTEYMLTEKGIKFAKAFERSANNTDKNIMKSFDEIINKYSRYQLLQLLKYIYVKYPEYQEKSIVWQKIKKMRVSG